MSIRRRLATTLATVTLVFAVLAAGVAAVGSWRGFTTVEDAGADDDAERVAKAMAREAAELRRTSEDWAFWDDTLAYVRGDHPAYVDANLVPDTFAILGLSDMVIADSTGEVLWAAAVDPGGDTFLPVDPALQELVRPGQRLHAGDLDAGGTDILRLDHGLAVVAHQPITDSEGTVEPAGTLVMVRDLDDTVAAEIADRVQRDVTIESFDPTVPTRERTDAEVLTRVPLGDPDAPLAVLAVTTPRDVSAVGRSSILWMGTALVALLLLMGLVTIGVVDRTVVRRLVRLRDDSTVIGTVGAGQARDDGQGDELNEVVQAVNAMVGSLYRTRQDLELRNAELAQLATLRQDLVAMFSHELRTPLTTLLGFAQTVRDHADELDPAQRTHFMMRIEANARHLDRLVGDLLVLSRADDSAVVTEPEVVEVAAVLAELTDDLGVAFDVDVPSGTRVFCDRDHLRRMVANLVENARRYGGPPIEVGLGRAEAGGVCLRVRDHGPGVPEDFVPHLFERFSQANRSDQRGAQGVGLGLAIVQVLAAANRGHVRYVPADPGAIFEVCLPVPAGDQPTATPRTTSARCSEE